MRKEQIINLKALSNKSSSSIFWLSWV